MLTSVSKQLRIGQREKRTSKRGEDRELIIRPLDRRKRVPNRFDLLARVKPASHTWARQSAGGPFFTEARWGRY